MIICYASDCVHNSNGWCDLNMITISDGYQQCEDYIDYQDTEDYQTEFYRAVIMDGVIYKRKDKGRRAEENGIVFYYWAKELESETKIIEEKTGRMASYGRLKELSKAIESILAEQGHVNALPEWSDTNENNT